MQISSRLTPFGSILHGLTCVHGRLVIDTHIHELCIDASGWFCLCRFNDWTGFGVLLYYCRTTLMLFVVLS